LYIDQKFGKIFYNKEREREREIKRMDEGNETTFRFMNGQSLANIKTN